MNMSTALRNRDMSLLYMGAHGSRLWKLLSTFCCGPTVRLALPAVGFEEAPGCSPCDGDMAGRT